MLDYHIHTKYCQHASGEMEDYVKAAIARNLTEMGFACHIPFEFMPSEVPRQEYAMSLDTFTHIYLPEIHRLQQKYHQQIIIKTGLEIDYCGWIQNAINGFIDEYSEKLDYIIGSIHILNSNGTVWPVDDHRYSYLYDKFGVDAVYEQYLDATIELIRSGQYHILAHMDLLKKYGFRPSNKKHYYQRIEEILELIRQQDMCIEVSTAGLRKPIAELYPQDHILKMIIAKNIPLITSSDSHKPEEVGFYFPQLYEYLSNLGVSHLVTFTYGHKTLIKID